MNEFKYKKITIFLIFFFKKSVSSVVSAFFKLVEEYVKKEKRFVPLKDLVENIQFYEFLNLGIFYSFNKNELFELYKNLQQLNTN